VAHPREFCGHGSCRFSVPVTRVIIVKRDASSNFVQIEGAAHGLALRCDTPAGAAAAAAADNDHVD